MQAFNPSTQEAEVGRSLILRPFWSTKQVSEQPGLHRETFYQSPVPSPQNKKEKKFQFQSVSQSPSATIYCE